MQQNRHQEISNIITKKNTLKNKKWDENGINKKTGDKYDENGFDENGINKYTQGYYDKDGYDINGWNSKGINKYTGTRYDKRGKDEAGYNKEGYNNGTGKYKPHPFGDNFNKMNDRENPYYKKTGKGLGHNSGYCYP